MRGLLFVVAAYQLREGVTPVQKVITLLQDMRAKGDAEKKAEEVAFTTFKQWCDDTSRQRQDSIEKAEALLEELQATIQKAESDISTLSDEIQALDAEIESWEQDKKAATEIRNKENADYKT